LPARFFEEPPLGQEQARLSRAGLGDAIVAYNRLRGWTDEGWLP
jgi:aldehyde:ferredoxin oxidoreductase